MKTNNWREELQDTFDLSEDLNRDLEIYVESLLNKQKEEIIKVIENSDTDNYKQDDGIIRYFVANKFDIINKIKELEN